jgi:hypothetical protein
MSAGLEMKCACRWATPSLAQLRRQPAPAQEVLQSAAPAQGRAPGARA